MYVDDIVYSLYNSDGKLDIFYLVTCCMVTYIKHIFLSTSAIVDVETILDYIKH